MRNVCRKYHVRRLLVFGSTASGNLSTESDIDLLVEFHPGHTPRFAYARMADELTEILRHPVDLHTTANLSRYFRQEVVSEAKVVFAETGILEIA